MLVGNWILAILWALFLFFMDLEWIELLTSRTFGNYWLKGSLTTSKVLFGLAMIAAVAMGLCPTFGFIASIPLFLGHMRAASTYKR